MLKNITIGQFYPVDSTIHRIDPRIKLLAVLIFITMLFMLDSIWGYAFVVACLSVVIYMSKVPPGYMLRGLRSIIFIIIFTAAVNILFTPGETVLVEFRLISITLEGVVIAVKMSIRLTLLIIGSSLLTLTTSSIQLTDALEYIFRPLKRIGVPSHEISMMMTIALRFIPTLLEETDKIMKAQAARGADFDTGGLFKKAKSLVPLLVPLFISAFRRADELAVAMEARCYRGDYNRTKMKQMHLHRLDIFVVIVLILFIAAVLLIQRFLY